MKKVIVIEDDEALANLLEIHLKDLPCAVDRFHTGRQGIVNAMHHAYDLMILDLMLPDMDGIDIARQLRQDKSTLPILMLTARSEEIDKVLGLESGADDYLTKPFSVRELIARVKAIFRRLEMQHGIVDSYQEEHIFSAGELTIDTERRVVTLKGKRIELTPKEFELLALLTSNPGKSFTRSRLLNLIWGYQFEGYEHTVNSHINRLRAKIEPDISHPTYILTTWGVGYRFNDDI